MAINFNKDALETIFEGDLLKFRDRTATDFRISPSIELATQARFHGFRPQPLNYGDVNTNPFGIHKRDLPRFLDWVRKDYPELAQPLEKAIEHARQHETTEAIGGETSGSRLPKWW